MITQEFGPQLSAWRRYKGLTQRKLAQKASVARPNISYMEKGNLDITLSTLGKIAKALDVTPGQLLDGPPPLPFEYPDRHEIDTLAKAIVSGERSFGDLRNRFLDDIASLIINRLAAHKAPGLSKIRRRKWMNPHRRLSMYQLYGEGLVNRILKRVEKYL